MTAPAIVQSKKQTIGLDNTAMLVRIKISQWGARTSDSEINQEVAQKHGSNPEMSSFTKKMLEPGSPLDKVHAASRRIKRYHKMMTLPWRDGGWNVIRSSKYPEYLRTITKMIEEEFNPAVEEFLQAYPALMKAAVKNNGTLLRKDEFPTVDQMRKKFSIKVKPSPIPQGSHMIIEGMAEARLKEIQKDIDKDSQEDLRQAVYSGIFSRYRELLKKVIDNCKKYKVTEAGTEGRLYETLLENIRDLIKFLPELNVTNDPLIDQFTEEVETEILCFDIDTLRGKDNEQDRLKIVKAASEIYKKMEAYV